MLTEQPQHGSHELKCGVEIKYTPHFDDLLTKKDVSYFYIDYMLSWQYFELSR